MFPGPAQDARSLEIALNAMPVGVSWATLADQKIIFMNRKFTEIFGYVVGDLPHISNWIDQYPFEEDRILASARWNEFFEAPSSDEFLVQSMELRIRCKNGTVKHILHHGVILPEAGWALATFIDISELKRDEVFLRDAERRERESQAIYRTLLDHSSEMIVLSPFDRSRRYVSPAVLEVTGFTQEEYLALDPRSISHPDDQSGARAVVDAIRNGALGQCLRYRALQKDGSYKWVQATATAYLDPDSHRPSGYVVTVRDISSEIEKDHARASEHRRLEDAATRDELTGIANRRAFNLALSHETEQLSCSSGELSLLLIDIDHFKLYNDRFGHVEGDACLRAVAQTIQLTVGRSNDLAARFGGEEFVILAPRTGSRGTGVIARRILDAVAGLKRPHPASGHSIVTVSIGGTSVTSGPGIDQANFIERADRALYIAKAEGRNTFRYLPFELKDIPSVLS